MLCETPEALAFQSTLPCEERLAVPASDLGGVVFQSTLPCEERPAAARRSSGSRLFQSTLPCEERLWQRLVLSTGGRFNPRSRVRSDVTTSVYLPDPYAGRFNPRSRVRSDTAVAASAHAIPSFNPRSRVRSDEREHNGDGRAFAFQSTLPCEERRPAPSQAPHRCWFQSTLPCEERPQHSIPLRLLGKCRASREPPFSRHGSGAPF